MKSPADWLAEMREKLAFVGGPDRPPVMFRGSGDDWMHRRYARWLLELPELPIAELQTMVTRAAEAEAMNIRRRAIAEREAPLPVPEEVAL